MNRFPFFRFCICVSATFLLAVLPGCSSYERGTICTLPTIADESESVHVCGEYLLSPDSEESPKSAFFRAYNDARKRAVNSVCGERVRSLETLTTSSASGQTYSGVVLIDSVGLVQSVKEIRRGWKFPKAGEAEHYECPSVFYEAEIAVKQSNEQPDPLFYADVKGGKSVYKHGERAGFRIISSKDAYLTVLWVNDNFEADVALSQRSLNDDEDMRIKSGEEMQLESLCFEISSARAKRETGTVFLCFYETTV